MIDRVRYAIDRFLSRYVGGHISIGPVTVFGYNTMHWAINIRTIRWGIVCFRPSMITPFGDWWRWYFYVSPNGTPWAATFAIGPGLDRSDKFMSHVRRYCFGHNFDTDGEFSSWNRQHSDEYAVIRWQNVMQRYDMG